MKNILCEKCQRAYPNDSVPFQCECGGNFDFVDFPAFRQDKILNKPGMWKYRSMFCLAQDDVEITLGEGNTPLLSVNCKDQPVWLKMENQNPTGSYKDRGTAVLMSVLKSRNVKHAVEDSSGNAGASFAAYCARAEISGRVFVPESASGPKRMQIEKYGAELVCVPGERIEAAKAVLQAVHPNCVYASHAFLPFGLTGIATIAYEIVEQLGQVPGTIIAPVGHGGLLYGIMLGFEAMKTANVTDRLPYYIGVQSSGCSPIVDAFQKRTFEISAFPVKETIAEGVKVAQPVRGKSILQRLSAGKGEMVQITEEQIIEAYLKLARMGIYVEPTSALVWGAINKLNGKSDAPTVAVISGSGYKSTQNL